MYVSTIVPDEVASPTRAGAYKGRARSFQNELPLEHLAVLGHSLGPNLTSLSVETGQLRTLIRTRPTDVSVTVMDLQLPRPHQEQWLVAQDDDLEEVLPLLRTFAPLLQYLRLPATAPSLTALTSILLLPPRQYAGALSDTLRLISLLPPGPPHDYTIYCSPQCVALEEECHSRGIIVEFEEAPTRPSSDGGSPHERGFWRFLTRVERLKDEARRREEALEDTRRGLRRLLM